MRAKLPHNEEARLTTLEQYRILDTPPEQAFDDLTLLAAHICGTPIALVSLVDHNRQWFKSRHGLDVSETPRDESFCAHALDKPDDILVVPDAHHDERFANNVLVTGEPHIRFYAGAPLVTSSGAVLGTLCVIDYQPRELSAEQQAALGALSRQVMAQLELRRSLIAAVDNLAMRVQTEALLRESQRRFEAFMDNSPLAAFLKDELGRYVYVNHPFLRRFNFSREQVIGRRDVDLWPEIASEMFAHDQAVLAGDTTVEHIETIPSADGQSHYWQAYRFPLQRGTGAGRMVAGVALDITKSKQYEQRLEEYQKQLETSLIQVEALSLTDGLTGLSNRRAFDRRMDEEFDRAKRYGIPLSVMMMDVDYFKSFNDSFGHAAGDELLQTIARLLEEKARGTDFVARYGGEEFVIVLPNTGPDGAILLAERFRRAVESMPWPRRVVTVSIGVASFLPTYENGAALLVVADKALYEAKENGRNRVVQAKG